VKDKISIEDETAIAPSTCYASLTHGSLFSGIGGFDLASEWMGWKNVFHCEWNDFGKRILKYYWPNAISYDDITKTDFTIHRGKIDILTGGFPCQPYSVAGKRKGKEDERHLWPEMLRAIREIEPKYIVGENVYGLTNWNGGLVFEEVQTDLENAGYEVQAYILPACSVNAPHRRDRVWFVAYSGNKRCNNGGDNRQERCFQNDIRITEEDKPKRNGRKCGIREACTIDSNPDNQGLQRSENIRSIGKSRENGNKFFTGLLPSNWEKFPTQSPICNGNDGLPTELDGITVSKWRIESIKSGGNAIVPQVALQIFKAVAMHNASLSEA
jgi:DNA (cytosine-5)-methyltransferase 1